MCRPVFGEMQLGVYYFFSCSVDLLIQIKVLPVVLQQQVDSQISSGDRMQTLSRGDPLPCWNISKAIHYPLSNSKGRWIAACNKPNLHVALHYLSPFSEMFPVRFEKEHKPLNKQWKINKQQTTNNINKIS
jgi:hypothetical protein